MIVKIIMISVVNYIDEKGEEVQYKSNQIKSYVHILETENGNKDNDHLTIFTIIMINIVNYIDKKEE